jgi:hypothetical protein
MQAVVVTPTGPELTQQRPLVAVGEGELQRASNTPWVPLLILGIFYLLLRLGALSHAVVVEDHDSVGYLYEIQTYLSRDLFKIINLGVDSTPVFPALGALFALPGWGPELGARLSSVFSSLVLVAAFVAIGQRLVGWGATMAGLVFLTFCPVLVGLSISVLTEPSYIATVYVGLALFWLWVPDPRSWRGFVLGLVFGLAFVNRIEGILFLIAIPVFQALGPMLERPRPFALRRLIPWTVAYTVGFGILAVPQVWNVSRQAGTFMVNGRQVWSAVLSTPGPRYEERIYGLLYSPAQVNIDYLESHPEAKVRVAPAASPSLVSQPQGRMRRLETGLKNYAKVLITNFDILSWHGLGELFGPVILILFGIGIVELFRTGSISTVVTVLGLLVVMLAAPLMHNVITRHIAIIAPLVLLLAGYGAVEITRRFETIPRRSRVLLAALGVLVLGAWLVPLHDLGSPATCNREYCPGDLGKPAKVLARDVAAGSHPRIVSRRLYFPYYASGIKVSLPYTDLAGLERYHTLNNAQYLFLDESGAQKYPFYTAFVGDTLPPGFVLLYKGQDAWGRDMRLFRFTLPEPPAISSPS